MCVTVDVCARVCSGWSEKEGNHAIVLGSGWGLGGLGGSEKWLLGVQVSPPPLPLPLALVSTRSLVRTSAPRGDLSRSD